MDTFPTSPVFLPVFNLPTSIPFASNQYALSSYKGLVTFYVLFYFMFYFIYLNSKLLKNSLLGYYYHNKLYLFKVYN